MPFAHRASLTLLAASLTAALAGVAGGYRDADAAGSQAGAGAAASEATEEEARAACGTACHRFPPPDLLPRDRWRDTIARMMLISQGIPEPAGPAGTAGRNVLLTPEMQRVFRFYQRHAPRQLPAPSPWPDADASRFERRAFSPANAPPSPAISHVRFLDLDGDGRPAVVASDMRNGGIIAGRPWEKDGRLRVIAGLPNPARFELFDIDGDRRRDLLVADLGDFLPSDHTKGAVVLLQALRPYDYDPLALKGWPRVADVRGGDFDGDGRPDLAVAAFGWRAVGRMVVLENTTSDREPPSFVPHAIDSRPGGIHAIPVDLDGDGRLDIVGLLAQQYETVVAYINTGERFSFRPETIYVAPHPNWGSSGIELVDLDKDGDLDVLLAHGDTFDDHIVKPYHGLLWLENRGTFPFTEHRLADLPGAFGLKAGDLDGDGDLDIVASAFMATGSNLDESNMPALVWLEQVKPGMFERRTLARQPPRYATLDVGDFDGDGDLDLVTGTFATEPGTVPWVEVWENRRIVKGPGLPAPGSGP